MCQMCVLSVRGRGRENSEQASEQRWLGAVVHVRESNVHESQALRLAETLSTPPLKRTALFHS